MIPARRNLLVYALLAGVWALVVVWQAEEHFRVRNAAKADLANRSKDIANTVSACIRGMRSWGWGVVHQERLDTLLNELVNGRTNELVKSSELISLAVLNPSGAQLAAAGRPIDYNQGDILQQGERWGQHSVTFVNPVDLGASLASEGITNLTYVLPSPRDLTNALHQAMPQPPDQHQPSDGPRMEPPPPPPDAAPDGVQTNRPGPPRQRHFGEAGWRPRRPPWLRGMSEAEFQAMLQQRALHGLVIAMSTDPVQAAANRDFWLRLMIIGLATVSVLGSGLAWRNVAKSSELQIRLVRASELNSHLKDMNLAAAGLAHETRNPLNIIRGLAQMISKQPDTSPEVRLKSRDIVDEADKVAAQLNEFINYSRPREVRRAVLALAPIVNEVVRALTYDLEEKKIQLQVQGEQLSIEADEQLLRQTLFNLLLNAVQAVNGDGQIQVVAERRAAGEACLEVRDNGPGVPVERRQEIFKPYFTMQKTGTGLGLAVVQQIVLAHGWEIECLPNNPQGAVFRISHLKVANNQ